MSTIDNFFVSTSMDINNVSHCQDLGTLRKVVFLQFRVILHYICMSNRNHTKSDKKMVQDKLEQLTNKESLVDKETMTGPMEIEKYSNEKNMIMDRGINTDPVNLTAQKFANLVDVKRSSHIQVESSQSYEEDSIPKDNQEEAISTRSKDQIARMPYRHPNHKN